ncbi:MAG: hypothetical protein AB1489_05730 [Acidobacteriota bacterium]
MDEFQQKIEAINLPITLSEGCFIKVGSRRIPDFEVIMKQLPGIYAYVDVNATAPGGGPENYLIPLTNGHYLQITLRDDKLVALSIT